MCGLLIDGQPYTWEDARKYISVVKERGIQQFCELVRKNSDRNADQMKWGDEIEYMIVKRDSQSRTVRLSLRGNDIVDRFAQMLKDDPQLAAQLNVVPEYGKHMIEATPGEPYTSLLASLASLEANMANRRRAIQEQLEPDEVLLTLPVYPLMGVGAFTEPFFSSGGTASESLFVPDTLISSHPRFSTLTRNIRHRRQGKVSINVPVFQDKNTPAQLVTPPQTKDDPAKFYTKAQCAELVRIEDDTQHAAAMVAHGEPSAAFGRHSYHPAQSPKKSARTRGMATVHDVTNTSPTDFPFMFCPAPRLPVPDPLSSGIEPGPAAKPGHIYMDAMAFGMGCCGLQCTFQCPNMEWSRVLADQLQPLCPVMLSLSAASPIFRGLLSDWDARYLIISDSVDDRTKAERGEEAHGSSDVHFIPQSRYGTADFYLSNDRHVDYFNDVHVPVDQASFTRLLDEGMDQLLSLHVSHLFVRDPLVIYPDTLRDEYAGHSDSFENIQSTNWQTIRWKPPPPNSDIGWRVEFRPMDIQLTDFENAAFCVFINLLLRMIIHMELCFLIPISRIHGNMLKAHHKDGVQAAYWFQTQIFNCVESSCAPSAQDVDGRQHARAGNDLCGKVCRERRDDLRARAREQFSRPMREQAGMVDFSDTPGVREMTVDEIMNGADDFCGLVPLMQWYLGYVHEHSACPGQCSSRMGLFEDSCSDEDIANIRKMVSFVGLRASGQIKTGAQFIRSFVTSHAGYKQDSVITEDIVFDLVGAVDEIAADPRGEAGKALFGDFFVQ
ncbi:Glutamate-cysteine ligase catalytic subunit [Carpediemonas membranifera]|uniref:Glutamate--cysteine ligase n=1 Tax=Carpediemonas membranifera TaxID=201153 RepID=A0A8J6E1E2_9EUKA|nr:Glutamate-cysteine ligase catalytic subunit [Carpediemonas membranifera]|eukprot:KAG9390517.1 Glutamate-cysteine ligase catalytic subunit [Carpediemonas membranifera]